MPDHRTPTGQATADLIRIIGLMRNMQAAIIQGDTTEADRLRQEAHVMLDTYLDHSSEAALAVRAILPT